MIENFDSDPNILTNYYLFAPKNHSWETKELSLQVLAFDHRTQFEDSCKSISTDKQNHDQELGLEGFKKAVAERPDLPLALLVDPYGADILQDCICILSVVLPSSKLDPFRLNGFVEQNCTNTIRSPFGGSSILALPP